MSLIHANISNLRRRLHSLHLRPGLSREMCKRGINTRSIYLALRVAWQSGSIHNKPAQQALHCPEFQGIMQAQQVKARAPVQLLVTAAQTHPCRSQGECWGRERGTSYPSTAAGFDNFYYFRIGFHPLAHLFFLISVSEHGVELFSHLGYSPVAQPAPRVGHLRWHLTPPVSDTEMRHLMQGWNSDFCWLKRERANSWLSTSQTP